MSALQNDCVSLVIKTTSQKWQNRLLGINLSHISFSMNKFLHGKLIAINNILSIILSSSKKVDGKQPLMYGHLRDYKTYSQHQQTLHHSSSFNNKCAQHINTAQNKKVHSSTETFSKKDSVLRNQYS